jgi:hypothetical protein
MMKNPRYFFVYGLLFFLLQRKIAFGQQKDSNKKVDRYGQLINADFKAKITTDDQLKQDAIADKKYYGALQPPARDSYGGLPGGVAKLGLHATGFFHVEKHHAKPVLVDPLGNLYFSIGVNGVGYTGDTYTKVKGRENIYEWLPQFKEDTNHKDFRFSKAYLNNNSDNFSFFVANRIKKTNAEFNENEFYNESVYRLKKWGFTSEGGFSYSPDKSKTKFPQVRMLELPKHLIPGAYLYDIYRPGFDEEMVESFKNQGIASVANDPVIIGYFFGNELDYQQFKHVVPFAKASEAATKKALVNYLEKKYATIQLFDSAWQVSYNSFGDLYEAQIALATEKAADDMMGFFKIYLDKFYKIVTRNFRKLDTHHLILGERYFTPVMGDEQLKEIICSVAGKYLDVLSYNYYTYDVNLKRIRSIYQLSGKPVMLTEYHYGDPTQGQTSSIQMMDNEQQKGYAYRNYVENLAASGFVVGSHWFEYLDQAVTGRWFQGYNGEGFGIGLLNVTDRPYKEFLSSVMKTNYSIYDFILGNKRPYHYDFGLGKSARNLTNSITIFKTPQPVIVDGTLDAYWPKGAAITLTDKERVSGTQQANSNAVINVAYDEKYLYVCAHISDNDPMANGFTGDEVWNGDGLEIFVGANNSDQGGALKVKDRQLVLGSRTGKSVYHWFNGLQRQPAIQMVVKMDDNKKGYVIEAAIPLDALNITDVFKEKKVRFDIGFDNGDERQRNTQYMWNGTESNSRSRNKWGMLVFN